MGELKTFRLVLEVSATKAVIVRAKNEKQAIRMAEERAKAIPLPAWKVETNGDGYPITEAVEEI